MSLQEPQMRSVLVVEDESDLRQLIEELIADQGLEVDTAENGKVALEKVESRAFDAILCDISMPVLDGLQFLSELRSRAVETPVVILTGYDDKEKILTALRLGALDYLEKPFERKMLLEVIFRAVEIGVRRRWINLKADDEVQREKKMISLLQAVNQRKHSK